MTYYIDIDDTICVTMGLDYENSKPLKDRIAKINKLFDDGHEIIYWTARGSGDWRTVDDVNEIMTLTHNQLDSWGCKRHSTKLGKPIFDFFIDDKAFNSEDFFE